MKKHYIDIVGKWAFVLAYDIGWSDTEELAGWLEALGASDEDIDEACELILMTNKGFTFSNPLLRMSLTCIGRASDKAQWWDTLTHEIDHLQDVILMYYGVEHGTEDAAWLQGYIMRKIVEAVF